MLIHLVDRKLRALINTEYTVFNYIHGIKVKLKYEKYIGLSMFKGKFQMLAKGFIIYGSSVGFSSFKTCEKKYDLQVNLQL